MHPNRPILTLAYAAAMSAIVISMIPANLGSKALTFMRSQYLQKLGAPDVATAPVHKFVFLAGPASAPPFDEAKVERECARARLAMAQAKVQMKVAQLQAAQGIRIAQLQAAQQAWQAQADATKAYWDSRSRP